MGQILRFTGMLLRAYVRDVAALFWTLFFPIGFMLLFGFLNFEGGLGSVNVGIVDRAGTASSEQFVDGLGRIETMKITRGTLDAELGALREGDRDMVIEIPADFRIAPVSQGGAAPTLTLHENEARAQQVAVGEAILNQVINQLSLAVTNSAPVVNLERQSISTRDLGYIDFLMPGIVAMNIMQLAVFSVSFGLVADKQRGVLRRIMATPMKPRSFLASHVLMRLLLAVIQVGILIAVALLLFKVQIVGSVLDILALTVLGSILFLTIGFAVAGWAANENQAAPVSQLIVLPQMFLSGVFFSREVVPEAVRTVTNLFPLTFLADSLRAVSTEGASLFALRGEIVGLLVWSAIGFVLALRFFRFES